MRRKILAVTGTRADYGLMTPVFERIRSRAELRLGLVVTGMHLLPEFRSSLDTIRADGLGDLHYASMLLGEDSGKAMAQGLGLAIVSMAAILEAERPEIVLLQGDRGEMLAGALAAAHLNIPVVHMSGGDFTGSIDDSLRNAISKIAHLHLTSCDPSSDRLLGLGEARNRIFEVGEPGLDMIRRLDYVPAEELARELGLDLRSPVALATQHPVTTEADEAPGQIRETLEALAELGLQTVFTYPNADAGGREMAGVLESYRGRDFLRVVANLGSRTYLSLMRIASVMVGNSSSGILEAPSFKLPVVNVGTRQHGRLRANNVIDVGYPRQEIVAAVRFALADDGFRRRLETCTNPYGDGHTAGRTAAILQRLRLVPSLLTKWIVTDECFLAEGPDAL